MANGKMKQIVSKIMIGTFAAAACFSLLTNLPAVSVPVNADSGVAVNEENFPDENFRKYVSDKCDTDKNGYLSSDEITYTKTMYVNRKGISDLKGIEYFSALKKLDCSENKLTSLNLSKNIDLAQLDCYNNKLTSLDLSKNTALTKLFCYHNLLTSLNVKNCTHLTSLYCHENKLTSVEISKNTLLESLNCSDNEITNLNIRYNTELKRLYCYYNQLKSLDVSKCSKLESLYCSYNQLTSLDLSKCTKLIELFCNGNLIESLDVSMCAQLRDIWCFDNPFTEIIVAYDSYQMSAYLAGEITKDEDVPSAAITYGNIDDGYFYIGYSVRVITPLDPGWNEQGGNWVYIFEDGSIAVGWAEVSGVWYYFGTNGKMVKGWQKIGGKDYYFKSSGEMASDEYIDGYYLDKNGAWTYKYRASWKKDSKGWYYQDTKGWYPKNQWLKIDDQWYFFKPDGYMAAAEYWNGYWFNTNGTWTYKPQASWKKDSNGWYYQDTAGWYAKNQTLKIDGKLYKFDAKGYCTNP